MAECYKELASWMTIVCLKPEDFCLPGRFEIEFKAMEREKRRVAKELHDEILPAMARAIRKIESEENSSSNQQSILLELHSTVAAIRDFLGELHPVDLEELGLVPALNNICARYARLTGLCVLFIEKTEEFLITDSQALCIYRAVQAALRMFSNSGNDIFLLSCERSSGQNIITVRCVDKRVSSAEWLSVDKREFDLFESLCKSACASVEIGKSKSAGFPLDLVISISANKSDFDNDLCLERRVQRDWSLFETLAKEAERQRIKEEIEKLILPRFAYLIELASALSDKMLEEKLQSLVLTIKEIVLELSPLAFAEAGLLASIKTLLGCFEEESKIETAFTFDAELDQVELSLSAKFALYRVTQEALNNIEKHSAASRVLLSLRQSIQWLYLSIEDNGKGFRESKSTQSRGLKNIRERAVQIGAEVVWVRSAAFPTGTLLKISCPLQSLACPNSKIESKFQLAQFFSLG